jgi:hypothetical protein
MAVCFTTRERAQKKTIENPPNGGQKQPNRGARSSKHVEPVGRRKQMKSQKVMLTDFESLHRPSKIPCV